MYWTDQQFTTVLWNWLLVVLILSSKRMSFERASLIKTVVKTCLAVCNTGIPQSDYKAQLMPLPLQLLLFFCKKKWMLPITAITHLFAIFHTSWQWADHEDTHLESSYFMLLPVSQSLPGSLSCRTRNCTTASDSLHIITAWLLQLAIISSSLVNHSSAAACDESDIAWYIMD